MYREYQQQAKSLRQRAEVLLRVKTAVKELIGGPGAELRQLIDREADMLARHAPHNTQEPSICIGFVHQITGHAEEDMLIGLSRVRSGAWDAD